MIETFLCFSLKTGITRRGSRKFFKGGYGIRMGGKREVDKYIQIYTSIDNMCSGENLTTNIHLFFLFLFLSYALFHALLFF